MKKLILATAAIASLAAATMPAAAQPIVREGPHGRVAVVTHSAPVMHRHVIVRHRHRVMIWDAHHRHHHWGYR